MLPIIDEASRTATARVVINNAEHRLKPGQFLTAHIKTGEAKMAVLIRSAAIVEIEGRKSVFVPMGDGFVPRPVMTGDDVNGVTQVLSGLEPGEDFVSDGAFTLKAQIEKDAFGDGHAH